LLYREEEREVISFCNATGVGLIPWGPLAGGKLARPLDAAATTRSESLNFTVTEVDKKIIGRVEEIAKKRGWTMGQVASAWINKRVSSPIIGFSSVKRLEEALKIKPDEALTAEEEKYLEELYEPKKIMGHS